MLVLSRRLGETLIIDDNIQVQILGVDRGQIRIGISAPKEINIVRSELIQNQPRKSPTPEIPPAARHPVTLRRRSYSSDS